MIPGRRALLAVTAIVVLAVPKPPPEAIPALYVLASGRWVRSAVVHLNQPARFVLRIKSSTPRSVHLRILRWIEGPNHTRYPSVHHIYRVGMVRAVLPNGWTRFSVTVTFHSRQMRGALLVVFQVVSGEMKFGYYLPLAVK